MAGKVTFAEERCKGCGVCVSVCPKHIILLNQSRTNDKGYHPAHILEMDKCIACAACAKLCPDSVIKVEKLPS
ncbi:MAG: 4Fe-4S binding protein [Bradymonadales bacterium]|jgi:2-oxoglutarate ferredoxin oxidoreductase subunit delta